MRKPRLFGTLFEAVRKHLTKFLWFEDRLCCLSTAQLLILCLGCFGILIFLLFRALDFLDDLAYLLAESDAASFLAVLGILLLSSAALWLFSLTLAQLAQRVRNRRSAR
jgi:hypothetical protein